MTDFNPNIYNGDTTQKEPIIQIDVEEKTGNPEHWVALEVEEPKKKKKALFIKTNKQTILL